MEISEKLLTIQTKLKAPKGQYNGFGKYYYRSCEDILEAVKPLLAETKSTLRLSDRIIEVGGRVYVEATATLTDCEAGASINNTAYAREDEEKKGMDASQITGSCSSYARKYALNGLFLIDDTKDADTPESRGEGADKPKKEEPKKAKADKAKTDQPKAESTEDEHHRKISKEELQELAIGCRDNGVEVEKICRLYNKASLPELTVFQYKHILNNWERIKRAE